MSLAMRAEAIVTMSAARFETLPEQQQLSLRADLDKAVELSPQIDYVFWMRGLFQVIAKNDLAGARRDVERVLALNPAYPHGFELRAQIHLTGGDYDDALKDFDKAIALGESDPKLTYLLYLRAISLVCAGEPEQAADTIEQAAQLRPNEWAFHHLQEICCQMAGNHEAAGKAEVSASRSPKEPSILALRPSLPPEKADLLNALRPGVGIGDAGIESC